MRRRKFITLLCGAAALWPLAARAQPRVGRVYRIGLLETVPQSVNARNLDALRKGLREHGYVEDQNVVLIYRSADGNDENFPPMAAELVQLRVDLIVTRGTPAALAAKNATTSIPIVMAAIGNPLTTGAVASLARPGGNITGLSAFAELMGKQIEIMKEMFPSAGRMAFMANMGNPVSTPQWEASKSAAAALGLAIELHDVRTAADIAIAFESFAQQKITAVYVQVEAVTQQNQDLIIRLADHYRIATMSGSRELVDAGGLASYGVSYPDLYYRAAGLIDKIFEGTKPAELPVEQPTKFELAINLKTAKALSLTIPAILQATADEVIE